MRFLSPEAGIDPLSRRVLLADAAFEAIVAVLLSGLVGRAHWWLNVERPVTLVGAIVFAVVAVLIAGAAFHPGTNERFVRALAFANLTGGLAIWVAAMLKWSQFEPEGHWLVAFVADGCLVFAALEFLTTRRAAS